MSILREELSGSSSQEHNLIVEVGENVVFNEDGHGGLHLLNVLENSVHFAEKIHCHLLVDHVSLLKILL